MQYLGGDLMHVARLHRRFGGAATTYKFSRKRYAATFARVFAVDAANERQLLGWGTPAERIVLALRGAAKQGQPALVAFLTAGYPSRAQFREHLSAVAQEADVAENELCRQHASAQQVAGTVEVSEDQVEQLGTLDHAELDTRPFLASQQHRHWVERPRGGRRGTSLAEPVLTVDVVGNAIVIE